MRNWMGGLVGLLMLTGLLSGCFGGPKFAGVSVPPAEQGAIYLYWPEQKLERVESPLILANDAPVGSRLQLGSYLVLTVPPGALRLETRTSDQDQGTELEVQGGQVYFVRLQFDQGAWMSSWALETVPEAEALGQIADCELLK